MLVETNRLLMVLLIASSCSASDPVAPGSTGEDTANVNDAESTSSDGDETDEPGSTSAASTGSTSGDASAADTPSDEADSSGGLPEGPSCSVQVVTHGALFDPVSKGDEVGLIPTTVGDALEDYCGCHTVMSNAQNVELPFLRPPSGSLFLSREDLLKSYKGSTLGQVSGTQIRTYKMPPGSCPFPDWAAELLTKWFDDGMPDGATFEPPE
jgi:hypothetical protein